MNNFYNKYHKSIRSFVAKRVGDEGVAEELTQDIILAAYDSRNNFKKGTKEFSWICAIAKHKIIDYYRKKKIKTVLFSVSGVFEEIADKALTPERDCLKNELVEEIKATLQDLGEGYHQILRLKYIDGLKIKEVANILKLSIKAVESKLVRAKKKFRLAWNYDEKTDKKVG